MFVFLFPIIFFSKYGNTDNNQKWIIARLGNYLVSCCGLELKIQKVC